MKKTTILSLIFAIVFLGAAWSLGEARAQSGILPSASGSSRCDNPSVCGDYTLNDFISLALNVSKWILGIVGSLTLVMFIYGGVLFLISGGSSDTVGKAKKTIVAAVIGLLIVLGSSLIIKTAMEYIGLSWDGSTKKPTPINKN